MCNSNIHPSICAIIPLHMHACLFQTTRVKYLSCLWCLDHLLACLVASNFSDDSDSESYVSLSRRILHAELHKAKTRKKEQGEKKQKKHKSKITCRYALSSVCFCCAWLPHAFRIVSAKTQIPTAVKLDPPNTFFLLEIVLIKIW